MKKTYWMKQSRQENITYVVVWGLLFAAPLLSLYIRTVNDTDLTFNWLEVFLVWRKFALYLLLFLIHNIFLAPLLIYKQRRITYTSIVVAVLIAFTVYQCNSRPDLKERKGPIPPMEQFDRHQLPHFDEEPPQFDEAPPEFDKHPRLRELRRQSPPPIVGERDILAIVVLILMFGANLGVKGYFRSREDRKRLAELEKQNLEQQLEYLRYQINPHFFMNTLNNIHALVDIDPAKAQETIVELSKMMRFVLYEGDKQGVPLTKEMEFIRTYVKLMQLRYTDKVHITLDVPSEVPEQSIPPLMLISFIENAFKHGISYQHDSFIEIKVSLEDEKLCFLCRNSKADMPNQEKGGVGLANVRKRLNLLYGRNYSLRIHDVADVYSVELNIPLS